MVHPVKKDKMMMSIHPVDERLQAAMTVLVEVRDHGMVEVTEGIFIKVHQLVESVFLHTTGFYTVT
jgi:hypothetical protein